jgi:hypothetical protein
MAKNDYSSNIFTEVQKHYKTWTQDMEHRLTRKNGWNDITDAYWGKLPDDWPYLARVVDPRIRTSIIEKTSRLLNSKLRGRLVPREGTDVIKARINNALLDYQWDAAQDGGSMLEKYSTMDQDTRLYGSKFALVKWRYEEDDEGNVLFNGNEFQPLDIRDCGIDPTADNIKNAKWFQHRSWVKYEDLEKTNDAYVGLAKYKNLDILKEKMKQSQNRRDSAYTNRLLTLKGLPDRVGEDDSFPVIEIVTEYRVDRWITFAPKFGVCIRDIPNPYIHKKIPVVQLKYYSLQGDPLGESEVEPVLPLWRAIQFVVCGFIDNINIHMRPPLKILDGAARIETIVFAPEAQWLVDRVDAVTEHQSNGEAVRNFQATYAALVSAFNVAMGDISQGVSSIDPTSSKKTATEIKRTAYQQNMRDQKNQQALSDCITDMMMMWVSNNKQFLFRDEKQHEYLLRIIGKENFEYFKKAGLHEMELPDQSAEVISDIINMQGGNVKDEDIEMMIEAGSIPKYPVFDNPDERNPEKLSWKPKMRLNEMGDAAEIIIVPEDLDGLYDYVPSIRSMQSGAEEELANARMKAFEMIMMPQVQNMLMQSGKQTDIYTLLSAIFEDIGLKDAERFFTDAKPLNQNHEQTQPLQLPAELQAQISSEDQMMGNEEMIGKEIGMDQQMPQAQII